MIKRLSVIPFKRVHAHNANKLEEFVRYADRKISPQQ